MLEALKPLLESGVLTEETRTAINEAWETKLTEAREQIRVEIREEFAGRYEHDRQTMVEAIDKMVTETLTEELNEFHQDRKELNNKKAQYVLEMRNKAKLFDKFMTETLAKEIQELRKDRSKMFENINKLESFVFQALAEEIQEFASDKKALVETRVNLVAEARNQLNDLKRKFVKRSSKALSEAVTRQLTQELSQLREDIETAKQNSFGRKIFEAFASEFSQTQLNESAEMRRLYETIKKKDALLAEAQNTVKVKNTVLEQKDEELRKLVRGQKRASVMNQLLAPLSRDRQTTMKDLLEGVQTDQLKNAFEKYLPAVLDQKSTRKATLTESVSVATGDKTVRNGDDIANIIEIKRLAGL